MYSASRMQMQQWCHASFIYMNTNTWAEFVYNSTDIVSVYIYMSSRLIRIYVHHRSADHSAYPTRTISVFRRALRQVVCCRIYGSFNQSAIINVQFDKRLKRGRTRSQRPSAESNAPPPSAPNQSTREKSNTYSVPHPWWANYSSSSTLLSELDMSYSFRARSRTWVSRCLFWIECRFCGIWRTIGTVQLDPQEILALSNWVFGGGGIPCRTWQARQWQYFAANGRSCLIWYCTFPQWHMASHFTGPNSSSFWIWYGARYFHESSSYMCRLDGSSEKEVSRCEYELDTGLFLASLRMLLVCLPWPFSDRDWDVAWNWRLEWEVMIGADDRRVSLRIGKWGIEIARQNMVYVPNWSTVRKMMHIY